MLKLIEAYRAAPTAKNAEKIRAYQYKHPMSVCMLVNPDAALVAELVRSNATREG